MSQESGLEKERATCIMYNFCISKEDISWCFSVVIVSRGIDLNFNYRCAIHCLFTTCHPGFCKLQLLFCFLCKHWHLGWIYHELEVLIIFPLASSSLFISSQYLCTAMFYLAAKSKFCFCFHCCWSPRIYHFCNKNEHSLHLN